MTIAMTAMLKQLQSNPPPAQVKAVEEICVTCGGAHPYYQCPAAGGKTYPEFRDNIQGYVSAAAGNFNQGNPGYRPQGVANQMRLPATTQFNQNFHLNELEKIKRIYDVSLKAMQNQIDMVKNELRNEMKTSIKTSLSNQTNKIKNIMASLLQMNTASTSWSGSLPGNTVANPKGKLKAITTRSGLVTDGPTVPTPPKSVNPEEDECVDETYTDPNLAEYTIKVPPPPVQKPKPPIQRHFVLYTRDSPPPNIPELKCKALADLGASINLLPLSVFKKLGLPNLIPTRMTLELANRAIYTPDGIARDVFVPVGKFTFPADFVVVDYESDPRVPLILGRPFLRTARALIDVHGEEMILHDGDERLTLNMKHETASYSNHPHRESVNLINIFNIPSEDYLEVLVSNKQSGNPTFSLHKEIASSKVIHEIHDSKGCNFLSEELPDIDSFNDIHPHFDDDPLSGSTTYSSNSLLEEFDVYPDDFLEIESDADNFYDDPFDSKGEKIKESELLIDQVDLPCDIFPYLEYDSFNSQDFSRDDDLPSPDTEDKVFNPRILIYEKSVTIITCVAQEKKLAISYASLVFKDFNPLFYEPLVFKEVPNSMRLLPFSSENEEKVFKPGIYTFEKVHSCFLPKLSHPGYHVFKVNLIFISLMKIFHVQSRKNTPPLDVPLFYFYPP
nr:reverse transcriptase domain-containing protein [Tanacetum cinerariifolium]